MIKSLKQYLSLRGLLARRLRIKKREIEAIQKEKNLEELFEIAQQYGRIHLFLCSKNQVCGSMDMLIGDSKLKIESSYCISIKEVLVSMIKKAENTIKTLRDSEGATTQTTKSL